MDKFEEELKRISRNDQAVGGVKDFAASIALYYESLGKAGVPQELAHELTVKFQEQCWTMAFLNNQNKGGGEP